MFGRRKLLNALVDGYKLVVSFLTTQTAINKLNHDRLNRLERSVYGDPTPDPAPEKNVH